MSGDANEPLLSAEETTALLDALRVGMEGEEPVDEADLTSPERRLRDSLSKADGVSRILAEHTDRFFLRLANFSTSSEEQPAEIVPYKVVKNSIEPGSAVLSISTRGGSSALLVLGPLLVSFYLNRRLGAPLRLDEEEKAPPRTELSTLDRRILLPLLVALVEAFAEPWCDDPKALTPEEILTDMTNLPALTQFEPMLQVSLRVALTPLISEQVMLALSAGAVRDTLPRHKPRKHRSTPGDQERLCARLREAMVDMVAVLGQTDVTLRDVLMLRKGDIIRLDKAPEVPLELRIDDTTVALGAPVILHGNLAIEVSATPQVRNA
ncbi:MAG: FliM/FliN family flagellar motor switch protein [Myxococcales bacterium]|nr:FliM/FliN family flagellar motor switch protein [Myxococcales bacterium]